MFAGIMGTAKMALVDLSCRILSNLEPVSSSPRLAVGRIKALLNHFPLIDSSAAHV